MSDNDLHERIRSNLTKIVTADSKPKDVLKKLQKKFPDASGKQIALASFSAMIDLADSDANKATILQDLGFKERS